VAAVEAAEAVLILSLVFQTVEDLNNFLKTWAAAAAVDASAVAVVTVVMLTAVAAVAVEAAEAVFTLSLAFPTLELNMLSVFLKKSAADAVAEAAVAEAAAAAAARTFRADILREVHDAGP
jgi:signal transduction histidine kinase